MKKIFKFLTMVIAFAITTLIVQTDIDVHAKQSAKNLIANALMEMQNSTSISGKYDRIRNVVENDQNKTRIRIGVFVSDLKYNYGTYIDDSQSDKGWVQYTAGEKSYRKKYDSKDYTVLINQDNDKKTDTQKKLLEYAMSHIKKLKITSKSKKNYTITAKPNWDTDKYSLITFVVNKKSGRVTEVKFTYATHTEKYTNGNPFTVSGGTVTYSNICYGDMEITLPDELLGK